VGVDGASITPKRRGWVVVVIDEAGFVHASFHEHFKNVLATYPAPSTLAVDIPIGLSENTPRSADAAARMMLGQRVSSVFPAPVRPVLRATSYEDACALSERTCGKKITRQTWALVPRIREVDEHREEARIHEVHPEVSFTVLGGAPPAFSKKAWGGLAERRRLLERAGIVVPDDISEASAVIADDILDAAVAAWSARRIAEGTAVRLPERPTEHQGSREITIWA
jgi:predicted RNase H-like nuclease